MQRILAEIKREEMCAIKRREIVDFLRSEFANGVKIPYTDLLQVINLHENEDCSVDIKIALYRNNETIFNSTHKVSYGRRMQTVKSLHRAIDAVAHDYIQYPTVKGKEIMLNEYRRNDPYTQIELCKNTAEMMKNAVGNLAAEVHFRFNPPEKLYTRNFGKEGLPKPKMLGYMVFITDDSKYTIEIDIPDLDYTKPESGELALSIIMAKLEKARHQIINREKMKDFHMNYFE